MILVLLFSRVGVGKSSILLRYLQNEFKEDNRPTIGVEYGAKIINCKGDTIQLKAWDTVHDYNKHRQVLKPLGQLLALTIKELQALC